MSNLDSTTRELWAKSAFKQVYIRLIVLHLLLERKQVFNSGTAIKHTLDYDEMDSLFQEYTENEPLDGGAKTVLKTATWYPKFAQIPVKVTGKEWRNNMRGSGSDGRIIPLPQYLVDKAQRAMRLGLNSVVYRAGSSNRDAETNSGIQGLNDALTHDITYGGLSRATTVTNKEWQGASLGDTFADVATAMKPTIANFRSCVDRVSAFCETESDFVCITSDVNWRSLQSAIEGQKWYKEGDHVKYGFSSYNIDQIEVFKEPWLSSNRNSSAATTKKYFYLLHLPNWKFFIDPERKLGNFTGFKHQAEVEGGTDTYLARIMFSGNLICDQPNASMFKSNVSM